jgi:hypothetical protein
VNVELVPAIAAGVVAGLVMETIVLGMGSLGPRMKIDMLRIWGTMVGARGTAERVVGFIVHEVLSALVGIIYAFGFVILGIRDQFLLWGLIGGLIHWFVAGWFLGILPVMHPQMPQRVPTPGIFGRKSGIPDVTALLVDHLAYGLTFGAFYAFLHSSGGVQLLT